MNFNEMFSDAFKYPLSDYRKFLMLAIPNLIFAIITVILEYLDSTQRLNETILSNTDPSSSMLLTLFAGILLYFIAIIFLLLLDYGMVIQTINESLKSNELPVFDIKMFFVSGLKYVIVEIGYIFIPTLIYLFIFFGVIVVFANMGLIRIIVTMFLLVISLVVLLVIGAMNLVARARLAETNSLSEAFDVRNIYAIAKKIGILKIVGVTIIFSIILIIINIIIYFIELIPMIGIFISIFIINTYLLLVGARLIALIYKEQYIQPAKQGYNQSYMPNQKDYNKPQTPNYHSRYIDSNTTNQTNQQSQNQQLINQDGIIYQEDDSIINKSDASGKINNLDFKNTDSSKDDE